MYGNTLITAYRAARMIGDEPRLTEVGPPDPDDQRMIDNHDRALAAQRSTVERIDRGARHVAMLWTTMMRTILDEQREVDALLIGIDPAHPSYGTVIEASNQASAAVIDVHLRMIRAVGEIMTVQAGDDIRQDEREGFTPDEPVDRLFGATVSPAYHLVLRPVKTADGQVRYDVVDPGGRHA